MSGKIKTPDEVFIPGMCPSCWGKVVLCWSDVETAARERFFSPCDCGAFLRLAQPQEEQKIAKEIRDSEQAENLEILVLPNFFSLGGASYALYFWRPVLSETRALAQSIRASRPRFVLF